MSGSRITQATECLQLFLRSLPDGCRFDIIRFGSGFNSIFSGLVDYTDETLLKAIGVAKSMKADLGGTELLDLMKYIFSLSIPPDRVCQIFLISDGDVQQREKVLSLVGLNKNKFRIFTVGISADDGLGLIK